jgi:hypothetical protein
MAPAQQLLIPENKDSTLSDMWNLQLDQALKLGLMDSMFVLNLNFFTRLAGTVLIHEVFYML